MNPPSLLEIILYIAIALIVVIYFIKSIYTIIDRKKHPEKYLKKKQKEQEQLDE